MSYSKILVFFYLYLFGLTITHAEEYWSRFRGPNGSGIIQNGNPPVQFNLENLLWKTPLPLGHSSPVIWGDKIFLTSYANNQLSGHAISRKGGMILWSSSRSFDGPVRGPGFSDLHKDTNEAAITPCVDKDRVYFYSSDSVLTCHDHQGNLLWERDLEYQPVLYGTGSSPVVHNGTLYLLRDCLPEGGSISRFSSFYAFDAKTGEIKWQTKRPFSRFSFSTPSILESESGIEVIAFGDGRLSGYSTKSGKELWYLDGLGKSSITIPVVSGQEIYMNAKILLGFEVEYNYDKAWKFLISFDQNKNGQIDFNEAVDGIKMPQRPDLDPDLPGFGYKINPPENFINNMDLDQDMAVTFEEFASKIKSIINENKASQIKIKINREIDSQPKPSILWSERRFLPEIPSILHYQNRVYAVINGGFFVSRNSETGKLIEKDRLDASGMYAASPVAAHGHVYFSSQRGVVTVMKANDDFDIVSSTQLDGNIYATPAIQEDCIYIRTTQSLYAFKAN